MSIVQHDGRNIKNINTVCPVPLKQQPVREYWCLRERRFFRWATLERGKYLTKLLAVWIASLLLVLFVLTLRSPYRPLDFGDFLIGAVIAELLVWLALMRLYFAWQYVYSRLIHREIDYTILATKDTVFWQKSELVLARDCLLARFEVRPILKLINHSLGLLTNIISSNFLILFLVTNY